MNNGEKALAWLFVLFMLALGAAIATSRAAKSHGPAEWVEKGSYKNAMGELCCGERDCGFFVSGKIEHVHGGYEVDAVFQVEHNGQITPMPVKGFVKAEDATPSPTGEYWACVWGGKLKCFFAPPPGA